MTVAEVVIESMEVANILKYRFKTKEHFRVVLFMNEENRK
jgi:hypothetical protein